MTTEVTGSKLTHRRLAFIDHYLGDANFNATEAARLAGYSDTSTNSLEVEGSRLLRDAKVQAEISQRLEARRITPDRVLSGVSQAISGAHDDHSWGAMVSALQLAAKLQGMLHDGTTINNNLLLPEGLTLDEIRGLAYPQLPAPEITVTDVEGEGGQESP